MTMIVFNDPSTACIWLGKDYRHLANYRWSRAPVLFPRQTWAAAIPVV
jgi:hypothetical protein